MYTHFNNIIAETAEHEATGTYKVIDILPDDLEVHVIIILYNIYVYIIIVIYNINIHTKGN